MNTERRNDTLTLEILQAIEERSDVTQRRIASRCGVALGLANAYLKRCVRKGLVKMRTAPANRYLYYLTPKGLREKSRLTAEYLSYSFSFYRQAGQSLETLFAELASARSGRGPLKVGLYGASDLAEIAAIRALAAGISVVAVCDPQRAGEWFLHFGVLERPRRAGSVRAWVLTALDDPQTAYAELIEAVGPERAYAPSILGVRAPGR
ncbi:MAG: winged helix-turn-helix transcriptional regulator [Gammaproteobacteria bacterium]|nr:winged helix-turn-helix transcriptional regulator [Gammaproteobacteria bacterium]